MGFLKDEEYSDFTKAYGLEGMSLQNVFRVLGHALFSNPVHSLLVEVQKIRDRMEAGRRWIGVHFRQGGDHLPGWIDPARHSPAELPFFATDAVQLCGLIPCSILFESDHPDARKAFQNLVMNQTGRNRNIRVVISSVSPFHIDRSKSDEATANSIMNLMATWHVWREMHGLVISQSGLSETASWLANVPTIARIPGDLKSSHISWP